MADLLQELPDDLPRPVDDGGAQHLPGLSMPALLLERFDGPPVALDQLGAGRTVLYLYPRMGHPDEALPDGWDAIPGARGCTPEACSFRDHLAELHQAGAAQVFGLSAQTVDYQQAVCQRLHLPYSMLADPGLELADALDLPTFQTGPMRLYKRLTLIVHATTIEHVFYPVFPPHRHAADVVAWLHANPAQTAGMS